MYTHGLQQALGVGGWETLAGAMEWGTEWLSRKESLGAPAPATTTPQSRKLAMGAGNWLWEKGPYLCNVPSRPWFNPDMPVLHRVATPTLHWRALLASLFQLNIKFSIVHCFELHIQLRSQHMGSKLATASRDPKRTPNPVSSQAGPGAPNSWDDAHPLSSAFAAPPPSFLQTTCLCL